MPVSKSDEEEVAELLKLSEGRTLEFKKDVRHPKLIARTLAAFANGIGGRLVVGVQSGAGARVVGLPDVEKTESVIRRALALVAPPVDISVRRLVTGEGIVLIAE